MTAKISLFDPTADNDIEGKQKHRTLDGLRGKVVGFIDNSKQNFNYLVDDLADLLVNQHGVKAIVKHQKRVASISASNEVMKDLAAQCDLVITGSGD